MILFQSKVDTFVITLDHWPDAVKQAAQNPIALSAFGGLLSYLRSLKLDKSLVSAGNIHSYNPVKSLSSLILDGQTLINLEVFANTYDGSEQGTLFKLLEYCTTPFGKRMFKRWVTHPLRSADAINARLDAIDDIFNLDIAGKAPDFMSVDDLKGKLQKLPDLERIIARIHGDNCLVKDFIGALDAFEKIQGILADLAAKSDKMKSERLRALVNSGYPDQLIESLQYFEQAFDQREALGSGKIQLHEGYDDEFDTIKSQVADIEARLEKYKRDCERTNS
jgi:DNA mismatch repair protein MSH6